MVMSRRPTAETCRATWAGLGDQQLLAQCALDTYRASGPGGQKRNKTSSAVRLRHLPSGLIVIAEESRSQHENKAKALKRLRRDLYLKLREPIDTTSLSTHGDLAPVRKSGGRLDAGKRDPQYLPAVAVVLDALVAYDGRVSEVAAAIGTTTGNLVYFLDQDDKVWQHVAELRRAFGLKTLH